MSRQSDLLSGPSAAADEGSSSGLRVHSVPGNAGMPVIFMGLVLPVHPASL